MNIINEKHLKVPWTKFRRLKFLEIKLGFFYTMYITEKKIMYNVHNPTFKNFINNIEFVENYVQWREIENILSCTKTTSIYFSKINCTKRANIGWKWNHKKEVRGKKNNESMACRKNIWCIEAVRRLATE